MLVRTCVALSVLPAAFILVCGIRDARALAERTAASEAMYGTLAVGLSRHDVEKLFGSEGVAVDAADMTNAKVDVACADGVWRRARLPANPGWRWAKWRRPDHRGWVIVGFLAVGLESTVIAKTRFRS